MGEVPVWRDTKVRVHVHQCRWGWRVEAWRGNKLLESGVQEKRPTQKEREILRRYWAEKEDEHGS